MATKIKELLGNDAEKLLSYKAKVPSGRLHLPSPDYVSEICAGSDRNLIYDPGV